MAKDTEEQINESHKSDTPRMSIREAIKSAREEYNSKESEREEKHEEVTEKIEEVKNKTESKDKPERKTLSKSKDDDVDTEEVSEDEPDEEDDDTTSRAKEPPKVETKPPVSWKKESKDKWAELPDEVRESILKREKEVSDGFAGTKRDKDRIQEFDNVLAQYMPTYQRDGVNPVQAFSQLLGWNARITHSDINERTKAFKELAALSGVNLGAQTQETETNVETETNNPPPWAQSLIAESQEVKRELATQRQQSTADYVNSWAFAKDATGNLLRPHYADERIKQAMSGLIMSGAVKLTNPNTITHDELTEAYEKATRTQDDIWTKIQEEKQTAEDAQKKADAQKRAATARAAKDKAVSLKPSAPTSRPANSNLNGAKKNSVRDSIDAAIREHMG